MQYFTDTWRTLPRGTKVPRVNLDYNRVFDLEIYFACKDQSGAILLSGCSCGYNGTGPNGGLRVLRTIFGNLPREVEDAILAEKHVRIDGSTAVPRLLGDV